MTQYQHVIQGNFTVGGKTHYFSSMFERKLACMFELCKQYKELSQTILDCTVIDWLYEDYIFPFDGPDIKKGLKGKQRGVLDYKTDFKVLTVERGVIWFEGKGYMDRKSETKLRCMKTYYPDEQIIVIVDRLPKGKTAKSRNRRARFDFLKQLGYPVIEVWPYFKELNPWFEKMGVSL